MAAKKKKSVGRPKKYKLDIQQVEQLAGFGCTNREMASFFKCSETTLTRNYGVNLEKGRDEGKIRLRQYQWKAAKAGNVAMLIWLGKQILGQTEKAEIQMNRPIEEVEYIEI